MMNNFSFFNFLSLFFVRNHFQKASIVADLGAMNSAWEELVDAVREQGSKLHQAEAQKDYNLMTADLQAKLADLAKLVQTDSVGEDMRDCKKLVSQHTAAEQVRQRFLRYSFSLPVANIDDAHLYKPFIFRLS
jgi:hypothetical protein